MSEAIVKKDGTDYPLQTMPLHYPADRVYLDGDTTKNVQDAIDEVVSDVDGKVSKTGDTMSGTFYINRNNGTASSLGSSPIYLGNDTPSETVGNSRGVIYLYGKGQYWGRFFDENGLTNNRSYYLPDKSGTLALERGGYSREYTNQKWIDILSDFWSSRINKTKITLFSRLHVHTSSSDKFFTLYYSNCMNVSSPSYALFVVPAPSSGRNEEIYFDNTATLNWYKRYVYNGNVDTDYSQDTVSATLTMYY